MPGRFALQPMLHKIWHAPDNIRILDPLPLMHRRGIIIGFLLVIIGFLLPGGGDSADTTQVRREAQLDLQSESQPQPQGNLQQPLPPITSTPTVSDPGQAAPASPEVVQEGQPDDPMPQAQNQSTPSGIDQQWRSYRLESGKTLAQLFRDHNLPATDAYAMSQVEGSGKPLSSLQAGQMVKIRQNASGVVTGLTVDAGGQQVLFTRQSNGSFIRAR
ncbi:TPA: hypothetical protein QDZ66_005163 [Pluralibacter gergoviae]|uniref:Opacity-associated protein A LysM-like domain n=1 Tax=Pluralibacter gergoviae TaxID=61647 RepID=A0A0J5L7H6_PLUGE|nr:LysM-like peptidoglycan-binding domain-containing protein [Pluralibacter gergoviae]KMK14675.1 hypothetical protein ABW06_07510 [Pluralibacter gergoviae]KMK26548.1 hypothetical protein ABW10_03645 [Pluralibacter gergoviae]MBL3692599.1 hypothetical protein [Pluralibacter gergoviae]PHH45769.1 hypothetical protein CRX51_08345 [Pluralibacter gergoviae]HDS1154296.1 hypothetical protein [Pluralibacter gergoviae]